MEKTSSKPGQGPMQSSAGRKGRSWWSRPAWWSASCSDFSCLVRWATGCQRRRVPVSSIWAAATGRWTIGGVQVTSKPVPPPTAPYVLGRVRLPLRAFLGFTFCFAGLQKLANPGFFDAASPASIQSQLAGAARRSPIHALISPLTHIAVPLGILIAFGELALGLGPLLRLPARLAPARGPSPVPAALPDR